MYIRTPFKESTHIRTIPINTRIPNLKGKYVTLSGWGATHKEHYPDNLQQTSMKITFDGINAGMQVLTMSNAEGTSVCYGDSGGTLFTGYFIFDKRNVGRDYPATDIQLR